MAEEKKDSKSGGGDGSGNSGALEAIFWVVLALVVLASVGSFFSGIFGALGIDITNLPSINDIFQAFFDKIQVYSVFLSLAFFCGIIYFNIKTGELLHHHGGHSEDHSHNTHSKEVGVKTSAPKIAAKAPPNQRWLSVLQKMQSPNESDWRLAVMEADIVLNDMLTKAGLSGEGVAEKLKQADGKSFKTLDNAWSAHKIRNIIAHQGSNYHLSKRQADEAIKDYKSVFEEFYFI